MTTTAPAGNVGPAAEPRAGLVIIGFLLCIFATGTAEFLVTGLLPQMARDLDVSVASVGQAVTVYALATVLGGPLITLLTARLPRKGLTLALATSFIVGTTLSAVATSYPMLLAGRLIAGLSQATLFAISLVIATAAVPPERAGRTISWITSGFTLSILLGVPFGTLMGQYVSWRAPFLIVTAVAVIGTLVLAVAIPRQPPPPTGARDELQVLIRRRVLFAVATTAVGLAGVGTVFTYVAPLMTQVSGFSATAVSALLFAYGAGSVLGNLVVGRLTDRHPAATLRIILLGLVLLLAIMPVAVGWRPSAATAILALGLLATSTITPLQALILRYAQDAPTLSVAVNVAAFNLANALGAAIGGWVVAVGALRWSGLFGAVLAAGGFALSFLALPRRRRGDPGPVPAAAPRSAPSDRSGSRR